MYVLGGLVEEGRAAEHVGEVPDAEDVVRVKARAQKVGASVLHVVQTQEGRPDHDALHVVVRQDYLAAVREVYERFQCPENF